MIRFFMSKKPLVLLATMHERTKISSVGDNLIHVVIPNKKPEQTNVDDGLVELMEALDEIDETKPTAKLNATSISDGNGGRILL